MLGGALWIVGKTDPRNNIQLGEKLLTQPFIIEWGLVFHILELNFDLTIAVNTP